MKKGPDYEPSFACKECAGTWTVTWFRERQRQAASKLFPHFTWPEIACRCCNHLHLKSDAIMRKLESVRTIVQRPVNITSGWRCDEHNKTVGGSRLHPSGLAADVLAPDAQDRFRIVQGALVAGAWGIGVGKDFVHIDWEPRQKPKLWHYY